MKAIQERIEALVNELGTCTTQGMWDCVKESLDDARRQAFARSAAHLFAFCTSGGVCRSARAAEKVWALAKRCPGGRRQARYAHLASALHEHQHLLTACMVNDAAGFAQYSAFVGQELRAAGLQF